MNRNVKSLVIPMKHTDVLNLKTFSKQLSHNMNISTINIQVNLMKIVWIKVQKAFHWMKIVLMEIKVFSNARLKNQFPNAQHTLEASMLDRQNINFKPKTQV